MNEYEEYVHQMQKLILDTLNELLNENILDVLVKGKCLKCNIRKYTINFSKKVEKRASKKIADLEAKLLKNF